MTAQSDFYDDVCNQLRGAGWFELSQGPSGSLWMHESNRARASVTYDIEPGTLAWQDLKERIGSGPQLRLNLASYLTTSSSLSQSAVAKSDLQLVNDVFFLRVEHDSLTTDTLPLHTGSEFIASAYRMLRSCATTAMGAMPRIEGHYRASGDEQARRVRMGHSIPGSYVLPIYIPLDFPGRPVDPDLLNDTDSREHTVLPEPSTRRISRIFSQSLAAVRTYAESDSDKPSAETISGLVATGVSREFVNALGDIVEDPAVGEFSASFQWATIEGVAQRLPERVVLSSHHARPLRTLDHALKKAPTEVATQHVGQIIGVHDDPVHPPAYLTIQVPFGGRMRNVRVNLLNQLAVKDALHWMDEGTTIRVFGRTTSPSHIPDPTSIAPADESFLSI